MQPYEVIKATSHEEAVSQSKFKVGQLVQVIRVESVANSDGTYSVLPVVGLPQEQPSESK